jgi:hypothetical protein
MTDDELDQRLRGSILSEEIDTSRVAHAVRDHIGVPRRHVPGWAVAAAGLIAMLGAGALSYRTFLKEQAAPAVCAAAAQDHQREIVDGDPREWLTDLSAIQSLGQKRGVPASAVAALGTTGYRLERGRLCFLAGQIFLHLVYSKDGSQYSVYLRSRNPPLDNGPRFDNTVREVSVGPEHSAYFQTNQLTAVFIGRQAGVVASFAHSGAAALQASKS